MRGCAVGEKFSRWTVTAEAQLVAGRANQKLVGVTCDCGTLRWLPSRSLRTGRSRSCGCLRNEQTRERKVTHGASESPEYRVWWSMRTRCSNARQRGAADYVGRGISVCDQWNGPGGFANFLADMGPRPSPVHSIDRIDNNGNYEPSNCRWATRREQNRNTRRNRMLTIDGRTMCTADWSELSGVKARLICDRLKRGWAVREAIYDPPHDLSAPRPLRSKAA